MLRPPTIPGVTASSATPQASSLLEMLAQLGGGNGGSEKGTAQDLIREGIAKFKEAAQLDPRVAEPCMRAIDAVQGTDESGASLRDRIYSPRVGSLVSGVKTPV